MKCPNCSKEIADDSVFCEFCGTKIKTLIEKDKPKQGKAKPIIISFVIIAILGVAIYIILGQQEEKRRLELELSRAQQQADEEAALRAEEQKKATLKAQGWIDLGLPSGTLWKDKNESGLYDYDAAVHSFGSNLPTKEQLEELTNSCQWTWTGSGYKVVGPSGATIVLPAAGDRGCNGDVSNVGSDGNYWSSTPNGSDYAWLLFFFSSGVIMGSCDWCYGQSVRLVHN